VITVSSWGIKSSSAISPTFWLKTFVFLSSPKVSLISFNSFLITPFIFAGLLRMAISSLIFALISLS